MQEKRETPIANPVVSYPNSIITLVTLYFLNIKFVCEVL